MNGFLQITSDSQYAAENRCGRDETNDDQLGRDDERRPFDERYAPERDAENDDDGA